MVDNATGAIKGNAGVLQLMAKNILKWSDKVEIEQVGPRAVNKIEIEVLSNKSSQFANSEQSLLEDLDIQDVDYIEVDNDN